MGDRAMTKLPLAAAAAALALAGCAMERGGAPASAGAGLPSDVSVAADARSPDGRTMARATAYEAADGIRIRVEAAGIGPGTYAAHVHAVGRCDPPSFDSAGPHWNPTGRQHGMQNPAGPHRGDLPNLIVGQDGRGTFDFTITGETLARMMGEDGSSLVVHAGPDDHRTDPSGNSGARIACGVFR
jgi:superoxide dismutase, Cu-Zn family